MTPEESMDCRKVAKSMQNIRTGIRATGLNIEMHRNPFEIPSFFDGLKNDGIRSFRIYQINSGLFNRSF